MTRQGAKAERDRRHAVETAKADKAKRATTVVEAMFDKDVCRATGRTLEGAAPLVFQAMCRREGIRVYFTHAPMTDGQGIRLGSKDLTSPLASVFVYGHGCHERHHVVYTDFKALTNLDDRAFHGLANVFEDIRIDRLGSKDYAGYLLWRRALLTAMKAAGEAAWVKPEGLSFGGLLTFWLLLTLEVDQLEMEFLEADRLRLDARVRDQFGDAFAESVLSLVRSAYPLANTTAAVLLAKRIWSLIKRQSTQARRALEAFEPTVKIQSDPLEFHGSLFDDSGSVTVLGDPSHHQPGFAELHKVSRCLKGLLESDGWECVNAGVSNFRQILQNSSFTNTDESVCDMNPHFASQDQYRCLDEKVAEAQRAAFRALWATSGSMKRLFQNALSHPVPTPVKRSHMGDDLDDDAIALMSAGEDRVFRQDTPVMGREMAVEILLDTSGSMDRLPMTEAKVAALRCMEACRATPGIRASLSLFPGAGYRGITTAATFETSLREAIERVDFIDGFGSTPILQALYCSGLTLNARSEPAKVIFVITDGRFDTDSVDAMIRDLKVCGIHVAMVGIGSDCTTRGEYTATVESTKDLAPAMSILISKLSRTLRLGSNR